MRGQGVVGLAIGVVIGVAVKDTVDSIVSGLVNPLIGVFLPNTDTLAGKTFHLFGSTFHWGAVLLSLINLLTVAAVIFYVLEFSKLDKIDQKKAKSS